MPRSKKDAVQTELEATPVVKRGRKKKEDVTPAEMEAEVKVTKRGRKKKEDVTPTDVQEQGTDRNEIGSDAECIPPRTPAVAGGWNSAGLSENDPHPVIRKNIYIEIELLTDSLGMMPPTKELLTDYIAAKAPDAPTKEEEIAAYGEQETMNRQVTIWPIGKFLYDKENDHIIDVFMNRWAKPNPEDLIEYPFLYNYQFRGLMKDACGLLCSAKNNDSAELKAYKKIIDGNIFVFPRHIAFSVPDVFIDDMGNKEFSRDKNGKLNILQRPLRISGPSGERTAISASEYIPAGSRCKLRIGLTSSAFVPVVREWLDYGLIRGIGQWRNSGSGLFRWRELGPDWKPFNPDLSIGEIGTSCIV